MDQDSDILNLKTLLTDINKIIKKGNLEKFKHIIKMMHEIHDKKLMCSTFKKNNINLIGLLCKFRKKTLLSYLLHQSHILHYFRTNNSEKEENEYKENAFYDAMCSNHIEILEMLYDYWSGDLHWVGHRMEYNNLEVDNLNQLSISLNEAFKKYEEHFKCKQTVDKNMLFHAESLIYFNNFQIELYTKLNKLKSQFCTWEDEPKDLIRIQETYVIRNIILTTLETYEQHQIQVENIFRKRYKNSDMIIQYKRNSLIWKTYFYFTHEVYFRKLDFNICLLILDNIHLLKQRLKLNLYESLEDILYQFNYHVTSSWRLYLPRRKRMKSTKILSDYYNLPCTVTFKYERNIGENGHYIIYLERRNFEKYIYNFKSELKNQNIVDNIRAPGTKLTDGDVNSLIMLPELRDDYSLKRMSQIIAQLYAIDVNDDKEYAYLLIERTLQVVGEFLKSSNESLHLEESTEALLRAEMSVEIIDHLKILRNMMCHAKKGKLLKRIDLEANNTHLFEKIRKELLFVKTKVDEVINVHKPFVEKALIENSLFIMRQRKNELPEILANAFFSIAHLFEFFSSDLGHFVHELRKSLADIMWLAEEAFFLFMAYVDMQQRLSKAVKNIRNNILLKFPFYRDAITYSLKSIENHLQEWRSAVKLIKDTKDVILSDLPNDKDTNKIISFYKRLCKENNSPINIKHVRTLYVDINSHCEFVCCLLKFIVFFTSIFEYDRNKEIEMLIMFQGIQYSLCNSKKDIDYKVQKCLDEIRAELQLTIEAVGSVNYPKFDGIKEISDNLTKANFLTMDEKEYLLAVVQDKKIAIQDHINNQGAFIQFMDETCNKVKNDILISMEEYERIIKGIDSKAVDILRSLVVGSARAALQEEAKTYLLNTLQNKKDVTKGQKNKNEEHIQFLEDTCNKIINDTAISMGEYNRKIIKGLNSKAKKILENLVMGKERDPLLPLCLRKRVTLLREIVLNQSKSDLVIRYKLDKTFRVILEVLLFDIFDILKDSKIVEKSNNLLTEINLRNILSHGSPLLEVVGNVLDSNDLPTELVTKALMFVEDEKSIMALCTLIDIDFDFKVINSDDLPSEQNALVSEFKRSNRWKDYLLLVKQYKQFEYEQRKCKKSKTVDSSLPVLIQTVYKNDPLLVQECLNEGIDVNFIYNGKKAAIHYAAANGYKNVIDVLLRNNANINIQNQENRFTALHYCALYGFKDSVDFLLSKGADCLALDAKGRSAVYLANQRKLADISRVLLQAMKRRAVTET